MSDRPPPIVSSGSLTSSALLAQWQEHQPSPQQILVSIPAAPGLQEAMRQAPLNRQVGVVHPYPKRPGEPDCPYYVRTGLCGFGVNCKFNHPPHSKLVSNSWVLGQFPERPGQPECQYYLKTGTCKFRALCKYHHPKEKAGIAAGAQLNILSLPLRPDYHVKYLARAQSHGGSSCFASRAYTMICWSKTKPRASEEHNSRMGERDCAFYVRTGNCKYGATCKFNHPPPLMPVPGSFMYPGPPVHVPQLYPAGAPFLPSPTPPFLQSPRFAGLPHPPPIVTPPAQGPTLPWNPYQVSFLFQEGQQQGLPGSYTQLTSSQEHFAAGLIPPGSGSAILTSSGPSTPGHLGDGYPQRPGQQECSYYMRTGVCKFGWQCKFHHPRDRITSTPSMHASPMGLPLRPGAAPCTFFSRFGFCKYGSVCKFDHSLQPVYPHVPYSIATTQITAAGKAPPPAPMLPTFAEASSGPPLNIEENAISLLSGFQQLNIHSEHNV